MDRFIMNVVHGQDLPLDEDEGPVDFYLDADEREDVLLAVRNLEPLEVYGENGVLFIFPYEAYKDCVILIEPVEIDQLNS